MSINFDNCAQCTLCYDIITSLDVHDFVECSCKLTFIDGGSDYRRAGKAYIALKYIENEEELLEARKKELRVFNIEQLTEMKGLVLNLEEGQFIDYYRNEYDIIFLEKFYNVISKSD